MRMQQPPSIPSFEQTVKAVDPLPNLVYGVMEHATVKTRAFFTGEKQSHDPFLAPCLMRFFAKHGLRQRGIKAEEDGETSDFEALPNNGLAFFYRRHHVRILKAAIVKGVPWKLPGCGVSDPKQDFYNQQLQMYIAKGKLHTSVLNIIFLWDFDQSFNLAGLHLACPMAAGVYAKDVRDHWCEPLLHPAFQRAQEASAPVESTSDDDLEALLNDDLAEAEAIKKA
jgi:hypothetical protein